MTTQRYSVTQHPVDTVLTWVKSGEIAIPEIQRPFVWNSTQVRNLLDSLYLGFPIGHLIIWRNPDVKLKDGSKSSGKKILIDGQQRVTALMASLLGHEIVTKDYEKVRIRIAFNPLEEKFEVSNPAIEKDSAWFPDINLIFSPEASTYEIVEGYCTRNPNADKNRIFRTIEKLRKIENNQLGIIELNPELPIDIVTEIFIRVNSAGKELSQADFAMSKIASNETYGGNTLRKAIDYFCHLSVAPEFYEKIRTNDKEFTTTDFFQKMNWLKNEYDNIYDPTYTDMLRVAFASKFKRGRLEDLVSLLSGRNFETRQFEEQIARESFAKLKDGVMDFINETNFKRLVMIIRSAGFEDADLIGSQNALNFAYILYLSLREAEVSAAEIEHFVRKWFVMSMLTGRYSSNPETQFDYDLRQITEVGFEKYIDTIISGNLSESFWSVVLPQEMNTSTLSHPAFRVFRAAQVKMNDKGFLSRDISVRDLLLNKCDLHHLFPKNFLKKQGMAKGRYNQVANYAMAQTEINISIGDRDPMVYFQELKAQCEGGPLRYGGITNGEELRMNLQMHCIPLKILEGPMEYDAFLETRRRLMSERLQTYFQSL